MHRINAMFAADGKLGKLPRSQRHDLRQKHVRPLVEAFFAWVELQRGAVHERGVVASALGDAFRQRAPQELGSAREARTLSYACNGQ